MLTLQANRAFMNRKSISILLSEEAENFVKSQPIKAQKKIYFNIFKVEGGVMDKELFKKLEDSEIWELRHCMMACAIVCLPSGKKTLEHT